jgi:hypothetical protein
MIARTDATTTPASDAARAHLTGHSRALELLEGIRQGVAHPDALARAAEGLAGQPDALRGLFRTVQKRLENAGERP